MIFVLACNNIIIRTRGGRGGRGTDDDYHGFGIPRPAHAYDARGDGVCCAGGHEFRRIHIVVRTERSTGVYAR